MTTNHSPAMPRRGFLAASSASLAAAYLGTGSSSAQQAPAKWRRHNVNTPEGQKALKSYNKAIKAMLDLPYTDARNWYRNAFIHYMDCPHGNWWFLPWHRGYLGWFEQTCRELSGDPDFAFPFWDWTTDQQIPTEFFGTNPDFAYLNPANHPLWKNSGENQLDAFQKALHDPTKAMYDGFSADQLQMLANRTFWNWNDPKYQGNSFWYNLCGTYLNKDLQGGQYPQNKTPSRADWLTPQTPKLVRKVKKEDGTSELVPEPMVASGVIDAALAHRRFPGGKDPKNPSKSTGFGSYPACPLQHSTGTGQSDLESGPHNNVHNDIGGPTGGFMGQFLSPVDPIFFLHHSNIDRLWHIWTRKQIKNNLPTVPTDPTELATWNNEPFYFYVDAKGNPITDPEQVKSGFYNDIGMFSYDYGAGYGDHFVQPPQSFILAGVLNTKKLTLAASKVSSAAGEAMLPAKLSAAVTAEETNAPLFAHITFKPGALKRGSSFRVLVNPPADVSKAGFDHPSFAGSIRPFGQMHHKTAMSFDVSIADAVNALKKQGLFDPEKPLQVHVVDDSETAGDSTVDTGVQSIVISS